MWPYGAPPPYGGPPPGHPPPYGGPPPYGAPSPYHYHGGHGYGHSPGRRNEPGQDSSSNGGRSNGESYRRGRAKSVSNDRPNGRNTRDARSSPAVNNQQGSNRINPSASVERKDTGGGRDQKKDGASRYPKNEYSGPNVPDVNLTWEQIKDHELSSVGGIRRSRWPCKFWVKMGDGQSEVCRYGLKCGYRHIACRIPDAEEHEMVKKLFMDSADADKRGSRFDNERPMGTRAQPVTEEIVCPWNTGPSGDAEIVRMRLPKQITNIVKERDVRGRYTHVPVWLHRSVEPAMVSLGDRLAGLSMENQVQWIEAFEVLMKRHGTPTLNECDEMLEGKGGDEYDEMVQWMHKKGKVPLWVSQLKPSESQESGGASETLRSKQVEIEEKLQLKIPRRSSFGRVNSAATESDGKLKNCPNKRERNSLGKTDRPDMKRARSKDKEEEEVCQEEVPMQKRMEELAKKKALLAEKQKKLDKQKDMEQLRSKALEMAKQEAELEARLREMEKKEKELDASNESMERRLCELQPKKDVNAPKQSKEPKEKKKKDKKKKDKRPKEASNRDEERSYSQVKESMAKVSGTPKLRASEYVYLTKDEWSMRQDEVDQLELDLKKVTGGLGEGRNPSTFGQARLLLHQLKHDEIRTMCRRIKLTVPQTHDKLKGATIDYYLADLEKTCRNNRLPDSDDDSEDDPEKVVTSVPKDYPKDSPTPEVRQRAPEEDLPPIAETKEDDSSAGSSDDDDK